MKMSECFNIARYVKNPEEATHVLDALLENYEILKVY